MDPETLTVAYRDWRGEPRGKGMRRRAIASEVATAGPREGRRSPEIPMPGRGRAVDTPVSISSEPGDCIDCNACVNVCPMGIDIRDGQQLGCITCALCIDACDEIMAKLGKPRGLIDYIALSDETRERAGEPPKSVWTHVFRFRTILYTTLWSLIGIGLLWALFVRPDIDATVAPIRNPQFVTLSDGSIRNAYDIRLRNKHGEERQFRIFATGDLAIRTSLEGTVYETVTISPDATERQRVYLIAPSGSEPARTESTAVRFWIEDLGSGERVHVDSVFNGRGAE